MKIFERRGIEEAAVERKSVDQRKFNWLKPEPAVTRPRFMPVVIR
jgi:hypothetical protein